MAWPQPSDYDASVQNPRQNFEDPEVRQSTVATNPLGLPKVVSGNFASVYEFRHATRRIAVRCFLRPVTDHRRRYELLSDHLTGLSSPNLVGFKYVERGILARGTWYPIVKMEWVEGRPMHVAVQDALASPDTLLGLAKQWRVLVGTLRGLSLAHGDLQHGNVLVTPDGELRLVDYDGMFVPRMRGEKAPELGHPNYQHPRRAADHFNESLDSFAALVVFLALRALASDRSLWRFHGGENLILAQADFEQPSKSLAFAALRASPDPAVQTLAEVLLRSCRADPAHAAPLESVLLAMPPRTLFPEAIGAKEGPPPLLMPIHFSTGKSPEAIELKREPATIVLPTPVSPGGFPEKVEPKKEPARPLAKPPRIAPHPPLSPPQRPATPSRPLVPKPAPAPPRTNAPAQAPPQPAKGRVGRRKPVPRWVRVVGPAGVSIFLFAALAYLVGWWVAENWAPEPPPPPPPDALAVNLGGGVVMEFVLIRPGSFAMGSRDGDPCERPVHRVTLTRAYCLGKYEVTQEQWQAVMGDNPSEFPKPSNPVERVSWGDCQQFLARLNRKHPGKNFRLPTEAEWEYACRAGTTTSYSFGEDPGALGEYGWFYPQYGTHPVGERMYNKWGLYDMHGNVSEWCEDWYGAYDRGDQSDPKGPATGDFRVLRGGSFNDPAWHCRSACRHWLPPGTRDRNSGFRVAFVAEPR